MDKIWVSLWPGLPCSSGSDRVWCEHPLQTPTSGRIRFCGKSRTRCRLACLIFESVLQLVLTVLLRCIDSGEVLDIPVVLWQRPLSCYRFWVDHLPTIKTGFQRQKNPSISSILFSTTTHHHEQLIQSYTPINYINNKKCQFICIGGYSSHTVSAGGEGKYLGPQRTIPPFTNLK